MFDIGWSEILLIAVVALIAIGPKELPRVLYEIGKWVRRARMMAGEFQRHVGDLMHEAELTELHRQAMAARDLTQGKSLAELVDPESASHWNLDPTAPGVTGHPGSPPPALPVPPSPNPSPSGPESASGPEPLSGPTPMTKQG